MIKSNQRRTGQHTDYLGEWQRMENVKQICLRSSKRTEFYLWEVIKNSEKKNVVIETLWPQKNDKVKRTWEIFFLQKLQFSFIMQLDKLLSFSLYCDSRLMFSNIMFKGRTYIFLCFARTQTQWPTFSWNWN